MTSYTAGFVALSALLLGVNVAPATSFKATTYAFAPGRSHPNAIHRRDSAGSRTQSSSLVVLSEKSEERKTADENEDFFGADDGEYEGTVDWDAEWKKVVKDQDQPEKRPGNYKSQAEINAIKTTNKVAKNVYEASRDLQDSLPRAPSIRSLSGDWKFWIGMIAIVSFGFAIISVSGQTTSVNDSFYI